MIESVLMSKMIVKIYENVSGLNVGFIGDLGAGKTYFIKNLLKNLNKKFESQVQSPTFSICNQYQVGEIIVNHFDLYRLESEEELYQINFYELLEEKNQINFVEWVDNFPSSFSLFDLLIKIEVDDNEERAYNIEKKL